MADRSGARMDGPTQARSGSSPLLRFSHSSPQDESLAPLLQGFLLPLLDMETGDASGVRRLRWWIRLFSRRNHRRGRYFTGNSSADTEIRRLAVELCERIEWPWAQHSKNAVTHGWKPECGFLHYGWYGNSEGQSFFMSRHSAPLRIPSAEQLPRMDVTYNGNVFMAATFFTPDRFINSSLKRGSISGVSATSLCAKKRAIISKTAGMPPGFSGITQSQSSRL